MGKFFASFQDAVGHDILCYRQRPTGKLVIYADLV